MTIRDKLLAVFSNKTNERLSRQEIIDFVLEKYPETNATSIIPTDYCYNRINKDKSSFTSRFFEQTEKGMFVYLGVEFPYTGPIFWKNEEVGKWKNGECTLWHDPRRTKKGNN